MQNIDIFDTIQCKYFKRSEVIKEEESSLSSSSQDHNHDHERGHDNVHDHDHDHEHQHGKDNEHEHQHDQELDLDRSVTAALQATSRHLDLDADELAASQTSEKSANNKYELSSDQFNAVESFYKKIQVNDRASNKLLRGLMTEALKVRDDVMRASEHDIDRALETVDHDQDDKV